MESIKCRACVRKAKEKRARKRVHLHIFHTYSLVVRQNRPDGHGLNALLLLKNERKANQRSETIDEKLLVHIAESDPMIVNVTQISLEPDNIVINKQKLITKHQ